MEFILAAVKELSYIIVQHPVLSIIGSFVLFGYLVRLYCKITMGICDVDQDMSGKTVLITGATAGIGKETALELAKRNARVLLACRNVVNAAKVAEEIKSCTGNPYVIVMSLDLSSFESVRKCAKDVLASEEKLHVLINNAGVTGIPRNLTSDGCEQIMQTNHFGHFLLTLLLLDLLKRSTPSRIINISSSGHASANLDLDDLSNQRGLSPLDVYLNSKLANILFTRELAERLRGTHVTVNSLHPGCVKTTIMDTTEPPILWIAKCMSFLIGRTPKEGAQTTIQLAVDPRLEKTTGKYFMDCKEAKVSKAAENKATAKRLFELSERTVGVSF